MPVDPVRDAAIDVLLRVYTKDTYLSAALDRTLRRKRGLSPRGTRFLAQLVYGTVRNKLLCDTVLTPIVSQPLAELPIPILLVLRMGVFQSLFCNQVTFPAMVHTSVDLAKKRGHIGTSRLVNAVLKRVPQSVEDVELPNEESEPAEFLSVRYSMPLWVVKHWIDEMGLESARGVIIASSTEAPKTARVNTLREPRERLIERLVKAGVGAAPHEDVPMALTMSGGAPLKTKAFQNGLFFIQDPASMLAPVLLEPEEGELILDMCAAPGGKSTHMAELTNDASRIICTDKYARKMHFLQENIERLGIASMRLMVADALQPPFGQVFDRVLVDAPCTGMGTLRRHPDLKWRLKAGDSAKLAEQQRELLRSALAVCKNGGVVVYSVCTFGREETEGVLEPILSEGLAQPEDGPDWLDTWKISPGQYRILPQQDQLDGYFLTRLRKAS